jgi:hypothetical protein
MSLLFLAKGIKMKNIFLNHAFKKGDIMVGKDLVIMHCRMYGIYNTKKYTRFSILPTNAQILEGQ